MARDTSTSTPSRRTVARTAAWSALVLATAAASPVFAASAVPDLLPVIDTANANSYDTYSVVSHLYGIVNFGPVPTNGTTPI